MTASTFVDLVCDWPDCYVRIETRRTRVTEARRFAAGHGWTHIAGFDLCGTREQAEAYTAEYHLHGLKGHANREDHHPIIRPGAKGYVKLSCRCGWIHPCKYSWERPGETTRTSANLRWQQHVKEALAS